MLVVPMYHRASAGAHGNAPELLDAHFALIAQRYHCVLPGEPLAADRLNVCLTFDDAYVDFHAVVFPLLARHGLRAVLAVPVGLIRDQAPCTRAERLAASERRTADGADPDAYCTWGELREMAATPTVRLAAHGYTHCRLDAPDVDLALEMADAKTAIEERCGQSVDTFVLPYGRFNRRAVAFARGHYRHLLRIGNADNAGWGGPLVYRVSADELPSADSLFTPKALARLRVKRYWNALRGR